MIIKANMTYCGENGEERHVLSIDWFTTGWGRVPDEHKRVTWDGPSTCGTVDLATFKRWALKEKALNKPKPKGKP